jgi:K+-sensing histidine kinase KdpD
VQQGVVASANRLALGQILDNLLLNAIKYGAGHPIEVGLEADAETFWLIVRDHGIGMSSEAQARIFQRFERAVATGTQGGFGAGLWVVGQLVDAMGGHIAVDSEPGRGSTFAVTLPRASVVATISSSSFSWIAMVSRFADGCRVAGACRTQAPDVAQRGQAADRYRCRSLRTWSAV